MGRARDNDSIKSNLIINEVQKRPCLYDTNNPYYIDKALKSRSWEEVCSIVVPGWSGFNLDQKFAASKEVQKRWRSIRDSFTKLFRQGKCVLPEECTPNSRRFHYHKQMMFLHKALQNKKPRKSLDKYESYSEVSSSPPQHLPSDDFIPKIKNDETKTVKNKNTKELAPKFEEQPIPEPQIIHSQNMDTQIEKELTIDKPEIKNPSLEIKIDANSILPDDHFDDDKMFMSSLIPLFKKMDDDTRLLCRIEVLKIIRFALQGNKGFEALRLAENNFSGSRLSGLLAKDVQSPIKHSESKLSMVTRSADGSRPMKRRRIRTPSPSPVLTKKRGPGRPRKIRPPSPVTEEEARRIIKNPFQINETRSEMDEELDRATSVAQLRTPVFMRMYNLERTKNIRSINPMAKQLEVSVKTEPVDAIEMH